VPEVPVFRGFEQRRFPHHPVLGTMTYWMPPAPEPAPSKFYKGFNLRDGRRVSIFAPVPPDLGGTRHPGEAYLGRAYPADGTWIMADPRAVALGYGLSVIDHPHQALIFTDLEPGAEAWEVEVGRVWRPPPRLGHVHDIRLEVLRDVSEQYCRGAIALTPYKLEAWEGWVTDRVRLVRRVRWVDANYKAVGEP